MKIYKEPIKEETETTINVLYHENKLVIYTNKVALQKQLNKLIGEPTKELKIKRIRIIKMATYYSVFLQVIVNENLTIKKYLNIEKNIKVRLKNINKSIRFIDIEPIEN